MNNREGSSTRRAVCWIVELKAQGEGLDAKLYSIDFYTTKQQRRKLKRKKTKKNRIEIRYYEMVDKQGEDTLQQEL
jgi:hypothetical protein